MMPIEAGPARGESAAGRGPAAGRGRAGWYRSTILWLGIALFVASIAGCFLTVAIALRHADMPLAVGGEQLLSVPAAPADAGGQGARQ